MSEPRTHGCCSRRHFLASRALGVGGLALSWLLSQEGLLAETSRPELEKPTFDLTPKPPHHEPRARAMISLFMQGGPSHLDLLDPKPVMKRYDGQRFPGEIRYDNAALQQQAFISSSQATAETLAEASSLLSRSADDLAREVEGTARQAEGIGQLSGSTAGSVTTVASLILDSNKS